MAHTVEIAGVQLGTRRRVAIDLALLCVVFTCIAGYFDLRATVKNQTDAFNALSARLEAIEQRERQTPEKMATKADVDRIERRLDRLEGIMLSVSAVRR